LEPDPLAEDNHDDEKMDGPKALESPAEGSVSEPDLKRLLRSEPTEVGAADGGATDAEVVIECLIVGRVGTIRLGGTLGLCLCCSCSVNDSVDGVALRVFDAAANRCAAR